MSAVIDRAWEEYNKAYLNGMLERLRSLIQDSGRDTARHAHFPPPGNNARPPAIESLGDIFALSSFERDLLLLTAAPELNADFKRLLAKKSGDDNADFASLGLALAILPGAHWDALVPTSTLRYWRLVDVLPGASLMDSRLRIDERILHYLVGVFYTDDRLNAYIHPVLEPDVLTPGHEELAEKIVRQWRNLSQRQLLVQLTGNTGNGIKSVCQALSRKAGYDLFQLKAQDIPQALEERQLLLRLCQREAMLNNSLLLLEMREMEGQQSLSIARDFIARLQAPLVVATTDALNLSSQGCVNFDVKRPTPAEQKDLWVDVLGEQGFRLSSDIDQLIGRLDLGPRDIVSAGLVMKEIDPLGPGRETFWSVNKAYVRNHIEGLAQRLEPRSTWDDLVLPDQQTLVLREIAAHLRQRRKVYEHWGFADKSSRGLGISALFSGESGTGKTMAAETLANELQLEVFRIDLSAVVSKYIGETEKNLRRVFDAAEVSGAILLFDEADALFGKRSEVKDSHDRYANIEVSYLLQRMESYRGLAILTTNLKQALDSAFMRRIRFIVHFPYPDESLREKIWCGVFPEQTPRKQLDNRRLAQLNVTGGSIKNIAMSAAFLAAEEGKAVDMRHLLQAAKTECAKLERPLTEREIEGWI